MPVEQTAIHIGADEIYNRLQTYPEICLSLSNIEKDFGKFKKTMLSNWALGGKYDVIRFNEFMGTDPYALDSILMLIDDFPKDERNAIKRIDDFLISVGEKGFSKPNGSKDWAAIALFASIILTSKFPERFVDFRQTRWKDYAKHFAYDEEIPIRKGYGEMLLWAGKFAQEISKTDIHQLYWKGDEYSWVISGLCWSGLSPRQLEPDPIDIDDFLGFPEGDEKRRMHLVRERNQTVIRKAKEIALERDPLLKCEVCDFSFNERYGELGQNFVEAHHKIPIAKLKKGSITRVDDIALVCANCHRMIHNGDKTISVEDLRAKLQ